MHRASCTAEWSKVAPGYNCNALEAQTLSDAVCVPQRLRSTTGSAPCDCCCSSSSQQLLEACQAAAQLSCLSRLLRQLLCLLCQLLLLSCQH
jgi:hypothetical protein